MAFKTDNISVRREVLCNIIPEFGIPMKLVRPIKLCTNVTYSRLRVRKNLPDIFPLKNGLKKGHHLLPLLFNISLEYALMGVKVNQDSLKLKGTY